MRVEIKRLHAQLGATMIYVTHDQVEAMTMGDRIVVMKDGRIHQVADPLTLYDQPADRFVAGFIGTPPMNFFEGMIRVEGPAVMFVAKDGFTLPVPKRRQAALRAYADRSVTLGIRPEDIGAPASAFPPDQATIRAKVDVTEPMGSETYVYLTVGATSFVCRAESRHRFEAGMEADLPVRMEKVHFFDVATEKRIGQH